MVQYRQLLSNWVHKTFIRRHIVIDTAIQPTIQPGATKQNVAINDISAPTKTQLLFVKTN